MAALSRFYGMPVPAGVDEVRREGLSDLDTDDLFVAHLRRNYGYFGSIDKTLSGFVVLCDEGDDAWLLDVRDTGAVYFQDHEDRSFAPRFASLQAYVRWAAKDKDKDKGDEGDDGDDAAWVGDEPTSTRVVSTVDLARRLQWAVWFFAQATRDIGTDSVNRETNSGIGWFLEQIGVDPKVKYDAEREALKNDPHLACSWLLVAAALADPAFTRDIIEQGPTDNPLFDAFTRALRDLDPKDSLDVLPVFAHRKGRLLAETATRWNDPASVDRMALALTVAPNDVPLERARWMAGLARERGRVDDARAFAQTLSDSVLGCALRALLDAQTGARATPAINSGLALVSDAALDPRERTYLFASLAPAVDDHPLLLSAARTILGIDAFHFVALEQGARAAQALGLPEGAELQRLHRSLSAIRPVYLHCLKQAPKEELLSGRAEAAALPAEKRQLLVQRVLAASETFHHSLVADCLLWSLPQPYPQRGVHWRRALGALGYSTGPKAIEALRQQMPEPEAHVVTDVQTVLATPLDVEGAPILADTARKDIVKALSAWLAARKSDSAINDLLDQLESGDSAMQQAIISSALNPFDEGCVLKRMDDQQALRAARVLVETQCTKEKSDVRLFHEAGHQLYRFAHPGAEAYLIERLQHESGEDLVANLYAAVARSKTEAAKSAIIERLFTETRWFWRMASAVSTIWSDEVEQRVYAEIEGRKDRDGILGASRLAAALSHHVPNSSQSLIALGKRMSTWMPTSSDDKRHLAYVLLEAGRVALQQKHYSDARPLLDAADALGAEPLSDYHSIDRKDPWENPFVTDPELKTLAADLRSGKLEEAQEALKAASAKAKSSGKPQLKMNDAKLAELASVAFGRRIFHDVERGTIWFTSAEGRLGFFDGFEVTKPPFEVQHDPLLSTFVAEAEGFSERGVWWTKTADEFIDVARFGRHVYLGCGTNNGRWERFGLVFDDDAAAAAAVERMRVSPLKGFAQSLPWYVPRRGGIVRILHQPKAEGVAHNGKVWVFATEDEDVAAAEKLYWRSIKDHPDTRAVSVEWMDSYQRDAERPVQQVMQARFHQRGLSAADAVTLPLKMRGLLREAGFDADVVDDHQDPPVGSDASKNLDFVEDAAVRDGLRELYKKVGAVRVRVGQALIELVPLAQLNSLDDVIARRSGAGEGVDDVTLGELVNMGHFGEAVAWSFAFIPDAIAVVLPEVQGRLCGAKPGLDVERVRLTGKKGSASVVFEATLDAAHQYYWTCESRVGAKAPPTYSTVLAEDGDAATKAFRSAIANRRAKGWTNG